MTDSSAASSAESSTSEPVSLVGDTGPGFDPDAGAARAGQVRDETEAAARQADLEAFLFPEVAEESVRAFLRNGGDMTHALIGVGDNDWRATQADLDRIAPPATRILNRYQLTRAVAARSDEAALIMGLGLYSWRSMLERQAVLAEAERSETPRAPKQSAPAPGGTSPNGAGGMSVAPGYQTQAERMRAARSQPQRRPSDAEPGEDQPAT